MKDGGPAVARPEHIEVVAPGQGSVDGKLVGETEGRTFLVRVPELDGWSPGDTVGLRCDPVHAIPVDAA